MIKNPHELKLGTDERSVFPKGLAIDEEVYLEATSFEVATCPTLKGWRREEICLNAVVFTTATCQGLVATSALADVLFRMLL